MTTTEPFRLRVPTRWNDNDMYGHLNNTVYYAAMDTAINTWMIQVAGFEPMESDVVGYCVASSCDFKASASFPDAIAVELGVARVGTTSVTWAPRILMADDSRELATGTFTTVFVDAASRRPTPIPASIRELIESSFALPQL